MEKTFERKVSRRILAETVFGVEVNHNGEQGGDVNCGGFVDLKFSSHDSTYCDVKVDWGYSGEIEQLQFNNDYTTGNKGGLISVDSPSSITLKFKGDSERRRLIETLEFALHELKENVIVNKNFTKNIVDQELYPVHFDGKDYYEKDCKGAFVGFYTDRRALNDDNGVYVSEDNWVYPDGSMGRG